MFWSLDLCLERRGGKSFLVFIVHLLVSWALFLYRGVSKRMEKTMRRNRANGWCHLVSCATFRFSPEILGILTSNAFIWIIIENIVIFVSKYLMNISQVSVSFFQPRVYDSVKCRSYFTFQRIKLWSRFLILKRIRFWTICLGNVRMAFSFVQYLQICWVSFHLFNVHL